MTSPMLPAALDLAERGVRVFPCRENGERAKSPYTVAGFHDATTDASIIRRWWTELPNALIGGPVHDRAIAVDFDPYHGGTREALECVIGPLPQTLTVWSGRGDGGCHLFYRHPGGTLTSTRLPRGVDLREGGKHYTILPPSRHPVTGRPYRWEIHPIAPLPSLLRELLRPAPAQQRRTFPMCNDRGAPLIRHVLSLTDGERNRGTFWAACRAAEDGILDTLEGDLVKAAVSVGLSETEARRTVASAARTASRR